MEGRLFWLLVVLVMTAVTSSTRVYAQTYSSAEGQTISDALRFAERSPATGTRMMGMSGAGTAGIADYGALYANPAGLGYVRSSMAGGALHSFRMAGESHYFTGAGPLQGHDDLSAMHLGNLAYLYKAPTSIGSLVLGVAFNQINAYGRTLEFAGPNNTSSITESFLPYPREFEVKEDDDGFYPEFNNDIPELAYEGGAIEFLAENVGTDEPLFYEAVVPGTRVDQAGDVLEEGWMNELSLGGAWEAAEGIMIGFSLDFLQGSYGRSRIYQEVDQYDENGSDDYVVLLQGSELRGFDHLSYQDGFDAELTGLNGRVGVSASLLSELRMGIVIETPNWFEVTEDHYRQLVTGFDDQSELSASQEIEAQYGFQTPWRLGAGLAWESRGWLVVGDVEYVDWSQMRFNREAGLSGGRRLVRDMIGEVFNVRGGVQYRFGDLEVRAGVARYPDPRKEAIRRADQDTDRGKMFWSAGASYRLAQRFIVDLAWMQERFDDGHYPYLDVQKPPFVQEDIARSRFSMGVRASF